MYKYFIEFLGVVVILFAKMLTDGDPMIMALVYFATFSIGRGITEAYYTPLAVFVKYTLGQISLQDSMYYLTAQYLAATAIIITFIPVKKLLQFI
jgi:prolipoprotein diacylglyceryltransferase